MALKIHVFLDVTPLPTYGVELEGEDIAILRNVGNHLPLDTV